MHPRRPFPADFHSGRKEEGRGREARKEGRAGDIVAATAPAITDMGVGTRSPSRRLARRTDGRTTGTATTASEAREVGINSLSLQRGLARAGAGGRGRGQRRRQGLTTTRLVGHRSGCRRGGGGGGGGGRGGGDDVRMDAAATGAVHTYRGFEQGGRGGLSSLSNYFPAAQACRSSRNPF